MTDTNLEQLREQLTDQYSIDVANPDESEAVALSLWYETDEREYPVEINTGGLHLGVSSHPEYSDGPREPVEGEFFDAIAYGYHYTVSMMGAVEDPIDEMIEEFYDDECPEYERWAIHKVIHKFLDGDMIQPEYEDLREYINGCTEFGVPEVMEV